MTELMKLLISESGLSEYSVRRIAASAPDAYKEYYIPKRNGGFRRIAQPAKEVKVLQRALVDRLLSDLPIHDAAIAYRKGISIRDNALVHAGTTQILKMDFENFFPSILDSDWRKFCEANSILDSNEDLHLSTQILFHRPRGSRKLRLAIGAPSSPMLSNLLMFDFDRKITELLRPDNVTYSRYADDLTFSAPRTGYLTSVKKAVREALNSLLYPKLSINHAKTTYVTTKYSRRVTGLTLANDGRVTIGRHRKRLIRAGIHNFLVGTHEAEDLRWLAGMISFVKSAEPEFYENLIAEVGFEQLKEILRRGSVATR